MDNCKNCHQKLNFWKVYKSYWKGYKDFQCSNCGTIQGHKFINRLFLGVIIFAPSILQALVIDYYQPANWAFHLIIIAANFLVVGFIVSLIITKFFKFKLIEE
jgi:CXXC-20-CXXC protein